MAWNCFVGAASVGVESNPAQEKVRKAIKRVVHGSFDTEFLGEIICKERS